MSNDSQTASINGSRNAEGTSWSFGLSSSDPTGFTGPTSGIDSPLSPPTDKERDVWKQCTWLCDSDDSTGLADKSSAKPDLNPEDAILHSGKLFENQVIDEDPRLHDDVQLEDARYGGPDDSSLPPQATGADEEVTRTLNPMQRYVTEGSQVPEKIRVPQPQAFGSVGVEASQPPTPKQQSEEEHDEVQLEDGQGRVSDCPAIAPQDALEDGEVAQMSSPLVPASSSHGIVSAPSKETETPAEPTSTSKRKRGPGKEQQPGGKRAGGRGKRKHICVQCQYTHEKAVCENLRVSVWLSGADFVVCLRQRARLLHKLSQVQERPQPVSGTLPERLRMSSAGKSSSWRRKIWLSLAALYQRL